MKKVMKDSLFNPVFMEVPKLVNQMTKQEVTVLAVEMLEALLGKESKNRGNDE